MDNYDDIINLPHHVSKKHQQMSMINRAAQFAPFAALTGHDAAIAETARVTDDKMELGDSGNEVLNRKLSCLRNVIENHPIVTITYFQPDGHKSGGAYRSKCANIKAFDDYEGMVVFMDNTKIAFNAIVEVEGEVLDEVMDRD